MDPVTIHILPAIDVTTGFFLDALLLEVAYKANVAVGAPVPFLLLLLLQLLHVPPRMLIIASPAPLAPVLVRIGIQAQVPILLPHILAISMELALQLTAMRRADRMSSQPALQPTARRPLPLAIKGAISIRFLQR